MIIYVASQTKNQWFVVRMLNAKCPYVGHGLRVRRRRTQSPLTTYFSILRVKKFPSPQFLQFSYITKKNLRAA